MLLIMLRCTRTWGACACTLTIQLPLNAGPGARGRMPLVSLILTRALPT